MFGLFLERFLQDRRASLLRNAQNIGVDLVVELAAIDDAAAVLRDEELLRTILESLVRFSKFRLDQLLQFLLCQNKSPLSKGSADKMKSLSLCR